MLRSQAVTGIIKYSLSKYFINVKCEILVDNSRKYRTGAVDISICLNPLVSDNGNCLLVSMQPKCGDCSDCPRESRSGIPLDNMVTCTPSIW